MGVEIVQAETATHFQVTATLHAQGITEGFLSTLGNPFLRSLYKGIARAEDCGVLIAEKNGEILGFIAYARDVKSCYKKVLKSSWPSLTLTMIPNAFRPSIYKKVFETLSYPKHQNNNTDDSPHNDTSIRPELLAMAVGENAQGLGIGKLLVGALDEAMIQMGQQGYYVVTHGIDERSNGFYKGRGFDKIREYTNHGKPMNEYYKELVNQDHQPK